MRALAIALLACCLIASSAVAEEAGAIKLWHSYRGSEREALDTLIEIWNERYPSSKVEALAVPYEAYANKLTSAIPRGHGPDVFIAAHERIGDWVRSGLISAITAEHLPSDVWRDYHESTVEALTYEGAFYGFPLAFKSTALFVNLELMDGRKVPGTTDDLLAFCEDFKKRKPESFCLAYEAGSFYHHAAWLYGFGGGIFDSGGSIVLDRPENVRSIEFVSKMTRLGYVPEEPSAALVGQLFNSGKAALVINGPWFMGEIENGLSYEVRELPLVSETGSRARPFLTVEGMLFSSRSLRRSETMRFARFVSGAEGASIRLSRGGQIVAYKAHDPEADLRMSDTISRFSGMVETAYPMPNSPLMRSVWEPAAQALRMALRDSAKPEEALALAQKRLKVLTRPTPKQANPLVYLVLLVAIVLIAGGLAIRSIRRNRSMAELRKSGAAYAYIAPAAISMLLLVFVPFIVGTAVSLFAHRSGDFTFVGLANFWSILSCADYDIGDPLSFYFTLAVTVMWTAVNVFLHVTIGLALALLLRDPWMRLRGVYRVLLIVPWAVPNYITALIWKGMFHKQFGAINGLLESLGLEPVSWFSHFWTSFAANVATNTWLGFPFMMVVTLGALQAIPRDLEEAAEVDGAGRFQRFFSITLPLLKPALLPAVILGSVWTFNMFNIIYLVSGGEPDGATEILISEAYRWAFTRQEQYGYAAAYATLIFIVLLVYGRATQRLVKES